MSKIRDFRTRNEIIINVGKADEDIDVLGKRRGGPVEGSRPNDGILKRRLRPKAGVGFWDLGQIKAGASWIDIPWTSAGDLFVSPVTVIGRLDTFSSGEHYHAQFRAKLFEIAAADWSTGYRKFDYENGERYGIEVRDSYMFVPPGHIYAVGRAGTRKDRSGNLITGEDWTAAGLQIPDAGLDHFQVLAHQDFYSFDNNPARFRVTNEPSYAAPVVPLRLEKKSQVYLMPILINHFMDGSTPIVPGTADYIFGHYGVLSREFFLFKEYPEMPFGVFNYLRNSVLVNLTTGDKNDLLNYFRTKRGPTREFSYAGGVVTEVPSGSIGLTKFKTFQLGYDPFLTPPVRSFGSTGGAGMNRGRLMGAIYQNDTWFYIWSGGSDAGYTIIGGDGLGLPYSY